MSRRFDELEKKVEERGDDMMDLIMRTSEIQSKPKKHDKVLEILEHQITDLQEKLNTCNEDKAKIEQDKLKAEALAKRMFDSYDKLSKIRENENETLLMDAASAKSSTPGSIFASGMSAILQSRKTSAPSLSKQRSSADNFLSIRDGQHLLKFQGFKYSEGERTLKDKKTLYLKITNPPGFQKLGTLIDTHTDKTGGIPTSYYYFSKNPRFEYNERVENQIYYDPLEASQRQINNRILPLIDAAITIGVECIKSCGLTSLMDLPLVNSQQKDSLGPDFYFKVIFYTYLHYTDRYQIQIEKEEFLRKNIETHLDTLTKSYNSLSLDNYNILIATPGSIPNGEGHEYPRANEVTTNAIALALTLANFPMLGTRDIYKLGKQLGLINYSHPHNMFAPSMPTYSMFEKAQQFIKCQIDFIEKMMIINKFETRQIGEKTVKKAGVGLGLKTKRKYTKYRKSHKRKQRRQHKRTKRQRDNNV